MCGRFTLAVPRREGIETPLGGEFGALLPALAPRYHIAPSQQIAIVRNSGTAGCEPRFADGGLVPSWIESPRLTYSTSDARAETVSDMPAFRNAFRQRRCLIPADGWYAWERRGDRKLPWHFRARHDGAFAGLRGHWERDAQTLNSCTVIVTRANRLAAAVHERIPVIRPRAHHRNWLDPAFPGRAALSPCWNPDRATGSCVGAWDRVSTPFAVIAGN